MPSATDIAALELAERRAKRVLIGHLIFVVVCIAAAVLLRRALRLPLLLSWLVIAVPMLVFAKDIFHWVRCARELNRHRSLSS